MDSPTIHCQRSWSAHEKQEQSPLYQLPHLATKETAGKQKIECILSIRTCWEPILLSIPLLNALPNHSESIKSLKYITGAKSYLALQPCLNLHHPHTSS